MSQMDSETKYRLEFLEKGHELIQQNIQKLSEATAVLIESQKQTEAIVEKLKEHDEALHNLDKKVSINTLKLTAIAAVVSFAVKYSPEMITNNRTPAPVPVAHEYIAISPKQSSLLSRIVANGD